MEVSGLLYASAALPLGERTPATHSIGGWVGPTTGVECDCNIRSSVIESE